MASPWLFSAGPWPALPTADLTKATSRSVTWRLTDHSEAAVTLDGRSTQAAGIDEMITDLWVFWNGQALFRGRFGGSTDTIDADSHSVQFGVADYRELLKRRFLFAGDTLTYTSVDQSAIAWGIISTTQARTGGNLGIVRGVGATTGVIVASQVFGAGDTIGQSLDTLSQVPTGFDFDINPSATSAALTFDLYYPSRGTDRGAVLDYGGRVVGLNRTVDPSGFGNAVRGTGIDTISSVAVLSSTLASDPAGRWDLQFSDQSITVAATLTARTQAALAAAQVVLPSYQVTLAPNGWGGPTDIWLGDQVTLAVQTGRLNVVESLRVVEIGLALDENDTETMTVTLGAPSPKLKRSARAINTRLALLERR